MTNKPINGIDLEKMLRCGLQNLGRREEEINTLNVFPVPDGDTGTNMYLTLENGVRHARSAQHAGEYMKGAGEGMLLGARGNSGVILSQFFAGFAAALVRQPLVGPGELREALIRGYRAAYKAVVHPVEGTMLTVMREGIENIRRQITRNTTVETIYSMYIAEMKMTLKNTPDMLPVLKEAGVVDSGAVGYIAICEGMLAYLRGESPEEIPLRTVDREEQAPLDLSLFNEDSIFEDGYCTEFILQLMHGEQYDDRFNISSYVKNLEKLGNSIVAAQDGMRVKVHIHTFQPAKVIAYSQRYGEFLTFKLENMQIQHNEQTRRREEAKPHQALGIVAVVNGEGMKKTFTDLGCDIVLDGGSTMNTSSGEFADAYKALDADAIAVLANNPNVVRAAEQAARIGGMEEKVSVLKTRSMIEGYYALAMDVGDSGDIAFRIEQMEKGGKDVCTLVETTASCDYSYHGVFCKKGEQIALINGELSAVGSERVQTVIDALKLVPDIDDKDSCVVFRGLGIPESEEEELLSAIAENFPMLEAEVIDGGQAVYHWMIGI